MSNPYMPLFVADYLGDTSHLTTLEHGAYMLLIMTYWQRGKALSADSQRLGNIARMSSEEWDKIESTLAELFVIDGDLWTHPRIEKELAKARDKSAKARSSAERRHGERKADDLPSECVRNANAERPQCYSDSVSKKDNSTSSTELEPARVEKGQVEKLINGVGVGSERHADVTPEAKRQVCQDLNIADAEPLVRVFDRWTLDKPAKRSRDAWFRSMAPKLWQNNPAVHAACKPLNEHPPPEALPPAKPSSSLVEALNRKTRHAH